MPRQVQTGSRVAYSEGFIADLGVYEAALSYGTRRGEVAHVEKGVATVIWDCGDSDYVALWNLRTVPH